MARPSQRDAILDAAERVVIDQGAGKMTLDAVAVEAGVGKGGLLYHFPSKQDLLAGLIGRMMEQYQSSLAEAEADPVTGNQLRTQLKALAATLLRTNRLATAMIAVAANAPELLAPAIKHQRARLAPLLDQGEAGAKAIALHFALHGLFVIERLGITSLSRGERDRVIAAILSMADDIGCTLAPPTIP